MKRYVVTNACELARLGQKEIRGRISAGKFEVERDIAALLYYPCLAVLNDDASYADVTAAFNYKGYSSRDGMLTYIPERLIRFFEVVRETDETVYICFNPEYVETRDDVNAARAEARAKYNSQH